MSARPKRGWVVLAGVTLLGGGAGLAGFLRRAEEVTDADDPDCP